MTGYCELTKPSGEKECHIMENSEACYDFASEQGWSAVWYGSNPCPSSVGFNNSPIQSFIPSHQYQNYHVPMYQYPNYQFPIKKGPRIRKDFSGRIYIDCTPPCYVVCEQVNGQHVCWCEGPAGC
ncbi:hypothetical protein [Bacillus atrophaeus]|uniref:hypothetical protein n=1 Tax=Bacillus atrophaeus TaxID=1452 RepID=UPI00227F6E42|nr:hypothetical protein [Bacillus atrophaeus]MCY8856498.1 hypothetical protein [Bacillus atrophaeus]